ncbi:Rieske 2Fe-2S domain-containing protein [Nakamurella sp. YIM 132087]|uniref:Rieske 2Fe-2S domain-containing protein n=1 Tax=Nakamurella alba TaxID=2665158 RepID=A0A7K1FE08_9ACTN|nr:Rieske 2Fe-2S domain-containing protein [Nakamurella alba]MTD12337.1 Rieske 2Fe-2S domain-containing protein [Nakamurella alba]
MTAVIDPAVTAGSTDPLLPAPVPGAPGVRRFSVQQHEVLAAVGPGTPLGEALRNYWVPALLSEEIPGPDAPPVRVRLLGEDFVAFRDSSGRVGVLAEHCNHRGASLYLGRVADGVVQCVYHGWTFDVDGRCVQAPTCPALAGTESLRQRACAVHEAGGLVMVFLGDPDNAPPPPDLGFLCVPDGARYAAKRVQPCHWLQALEADTDSAHVAYLHREDLLAGAADRLTGIMLEQTDPELVADTTEYGLMLAALRPSGADAEYVRINHWLAPWYTVVPASNPAGLIGLHAWVPVDDHHSLIFGLMWHPTRDLTAGERAAMMQGRTGIFPELLPDGSYRARRHPGNDFLIDRAGQALGAPWSGVVGNQEQDDAITSSMGTAYDRTRENLVGTDDAVIAVRAALLGMARDHAAGLPTVGTAGLGFDVPSVFFEHDRTADFRDGLAERYRDGQVPAGAGQKGAGRR